MKMAKIGVLGAVLAISALATGCSSYKDPVADLDASCKFVSERYDAVGDGQAKVHVYSCDKGIVEIKFPA